MGLPAVDAVRAFKVDVLQQIWLLHHQVGDDLQPTSTLQLVHSSGILVSAPAGCWARSAQFTGSRIGVAKTIALGSRRKPQALTVFR